MNIRELLVLQSFYHCTTQNEIVKLIEMQGAPKIFYQSFLELERRNMVSILAFDSKTIKFLLDEQFKDYFNSEYPIFYINRHQKDKTKK